jgi:flagellar protein FliS
MTVVAMANVAATPQAYRREQILGATPAQLVVMLYDGARRFLRQAAVAMEAGEIERAHVTLRHAEMIIVHLDGTLDSEQGGDVAARLHAVYDFYLRHLNNARMRQDPAMLAQVSELLGELRDAFAQAAATEAPGT